MAGWFFPGDRGNKHRQRPQVPFRLEDQGKRFKGAPGNRTRPAQMVEPQLLERLLSASAGVAGSPLNESEMKAWEQAKRLEEVTNGAQF